MKCGFFGSEHKQDKENDQSRAYNRLRRKKGVVSPILNVQTQQTVRFTETWGKIYIMEDALKHKKVEECGIEYKEGTKM